MENFKLKYKPLGSISVLIEWPQKIDNLILKDINLFRSALQSEIKEFILDTVPAYNSLTVFFDTSKIKYTAIVKNIKEIYKVNNQKLNITSKLWKIPVCYEDEFGIDLDEIAKVKKI
ncbi:MAG: carboxyltransferase domain-containing protein, partial [Flavobacteriaceae bacterium]|nr:carboxyltransferase domain-containing protein [Flavobacteriaceae bacterium]